MLRSITNVRFREAASQRRDRLRMSGKGRLRVTKRKACLYHPPRVFV
ncbi:MAG: hypothetical protein ACJAVT_000762 [Yoonia sp.]|jgi:hypothetical protein